MVRGPAGCHYLADGQQTVYVNYDWNITGDSFSMDEADLEQLNSAWDVLRTMTPSEYTAFRSLRGNSSGVSVTSVLPD